MSNTIDMDTTIRDYRQCSLWPSLGLCKINSGNVNPQEVNGFLQFLESTIANVVTPRQHEEGISNLHSSGVNWRRIKVANVFPFYMESLEIRNDFTVIDGCSLAMGIGFPGQWFVNEGLFDPAHSDYYTKHFSEWEDWIVEAVKSGKYAGGLSCNIQEIPADRLQDGTVDVRPLTLHALSKDGRGVDRGDVQAQLAIANAFWQTFWATGATRAERGNVFPVAFLPVDRSSKFEFQAPFHERYVSLRRRLFGRSAIVCYVLEILTELDALVFDLRSQTFKLASTCDFSSKVQSSDIILALAELNRTGWIDAYTGTNKELFADWRNKETEVKLGDPWPYGSDDWNGKISASGHGQEDALAHVRCDADASAAVVKRVVPYAGCAFLYQVMLEMDQLKERGKVQDFDDELIGGTNSTFFLNFPEEYCALHSAMNEPVSLLVENGITRQIKTLKRASFVLGEDGSAFITTRVGNRLNSDALVFEGESSSTTYFEKAALPYRDNTFGPLFFGSVVVGNSIVETFEEIPTEVPPAGWLIGDSEAFGGRIDPVNAAEAHMRYPGELKDVPIRHAFAIGPLLVKDNEVVPLDESQEEFSSIKLNTPMTFEETSKMARTELPESLLNCESRGVPPTRFPYDWNMTRAPRSAIGTKQDGSVVVAVVDGRADLPHSVGATLAELAVLMKGLGCTDAMNMDGGGSSVMFVNHPDSVNAKLKSDLRDGVVNLPSDMGGVERLLPVPLVICKRNK